MKSGFPCALLLASVLVLSACGGGGGGGGGGSGGTTSGTLTTPTPPVATVTAAAVVVTEANSLALAADAYDATSGTAAAEAGSSLVTGVQVAAGTGPASAIGVARHLASIAVGRAGVATGVAINDVAACRLGGALSITGNVLNPNVLSGGDTITISALSCRDIIDGIDTTMGGAMTIEIVGLQNFGATIYPQRVILRMVLTDLTVLVPGASSVAAGDMIMDTTSTSATAGSATLLGGSLRSSVTTGLVTRVSSLKNYRITQLVDGSNTTTNIAATVETTNTAIAPTPVSYRITTPTALQRSGQFLVGGGLAVAGNNSGLLLTVTGTNTFSLAVDVNGGGVYIPTVTTTTTELEALR